MSNVPTNMDMEKEKVHEIVSEKVIIQKKDHKFQYLEDDEVEITIII
jgi:hypothetical protein